MAPSTIGTKISHYRMISLLGARARSTVAYLYLEQGAGERE